MKRIVLAVTNDLVTDQRVDRSCRALAEAGYAVTLVGRRLPESAALQKRGYATRRMRLAFRRSGFFYAEYNLRLFLKLLFSRADAYFANDTDTLLACTWAARLRGKKLFFDAHELFPEVPELVGRTRVQNVWKWVERTCLLRVDAAFTVCGSVAEEYKRRYGLGMTVVRNLPLSGSTLGLHRVHTEGESKVILYQGAVNVGRGVKELIDAMQWLPECKLVVAGDGDVKQDLELYSKELPWSERVVFLGRIAPDQLHQLTAKADLGVCLLEDLGLNYRYALPNRIADFAQAGVPILATDFVEIRKVVETYRTGRLTKPCPKVKEGSDYEQYVKELSDVISDTLLYWSKLECREKQEIFERAGKDLCWESEKNLLINRIDTILN